MKLNPPGYLEQMSYQVVRICEQAMFTRHLSKFSKSRILFPANLPLHAKNPLSRCDGPAKASGTIEAIEEAFRSREKRLEITHLAVDIRARGKGENMVPLKIYTMLRKLESGFEILRIWLQ